MPLPDNLRSIPQWLVSGEDKVPRSPKTGGRHADVRDVSLYTSYEEAVAYATEHGMDVGFALTPEDPFVVIDLDAPETEEQQERHQKIFEAFNTYSELSRSGAGVHIWCRGNLPRGVRRDKVEVYPHSRYIICTGKSLRDVEVQDCQSLLDTLFAEIGRNGTNGHAPLVEKDALLSDREVYDMAVNASNAQKFHQLATGDWERDYPSQSEADYALMNILAFYSRSNEQCKRLFRYSALGRRDKAQREAYLDGMLRKIRAEEPQPIDFSKLIEKAPAATESQGKTDIQQENPDSVPNTPSQVPEGNKKPPTAGATDTGFSYPPGLIGEIACYIVRSSTRPVPEVGTVAAIGLMAGILGRQYQVSGTGLNQYLILLAKTGVGKEGGAQGIERLLTATRPTTPVVNQFMGPGTFASGQGIIRTLDENPCFVSILGEFGLTLQDLSDNQNSLNRVMRRVLLDLYTKSGETSVLYSSAYSDKEKNTKTLFAPAMTLLGESTPESFYAGLSLHHIADGLIPRFLIVEYEGDRPPRNKDAFTPPSDELVAKFSDRVEVAARMMANNAFEEVQLDDDARTALSKFDRQCDAHIRSGGNEGIRQLWNRAHLKAVRLAALLAAADRPHLPVVNKYEAEYAIWLVSKDVGKMAERFETGDVGEGDTKQLADLRRVLVDYVERDTDDIVSSYGVESKLHKRRIVQKRYIQRRLRGLAAFRKDRRSAVRAINEAIKEMEDTGHLQAVPKQQLQSDEIGFRSTESCWFIREL